MSLIDQHSRAIDKLCRSFAKGNEMDFEDLRQEAIVNLWISWQNYRPTYKPITWVWRIVLNTGISWQRRNSQHRNCQFVSYSDYTVVAPDTSQLQALTETIALLPEKDQQLIRLYLDGWKQSEIAQMLSTTETNIQTRIHRIRKQLNDLSNE